MLECQAKPPVMLQFSFNISATAAPPIASIQLSRRLSLRIEVLVTRGTARALVPCKHTSKVNFLLFCSLQYIFLSVFQLKSVAARMQVGRERASDGGRERERGGDIKPV